jgi:CubicO group peptidase (beta-lactamase class C family)
LLWPLTLLAGESDVQYLVEELDRIRVHNRVAAFGLVLVDRNGITHLETRGVADRATGEPIGDDAIFRIGSITKMFTGLTALQLTTTGEFDLDEPVAPLGLSEYYRNPWADRIPITTAQLLEHTAGFTDIAGPEWDYSDPRPLPLETTLRLYREQRVVRWQPGLHSSYSNAGAGLAGRAMEIFSGKSYESLVETLVLDPLAMKDTTLFPPGERLPAGYDSDGVTPIPYWHQIFRPFAALNSSLPDMGRFTVMLLNRGRLDGEQRFAAEMIDRLETPHTSLAARQGLRYGYGFGNYTWLREGILFCGHGGDADGYLSRLGYSRAAGRGYLLVITAFQGRTLRRMQVLVEDFLIRGVEPGATPPVYRLSPSETAQRVGSYRQASWRFPGSELQVMRISETDGSLTTRIGEGGEKRLIPVTAVHYRRPHHNRATVFLGPDEAGRMYYQDDQYNFGRVE